MVAAWRIYRDEDLESLKVLSPGSKLFGSLITLHDLLVWASRYGLANPTVRGSSSRERVALLQHHVVAVTGAVVNATEAAGWPMDRDDSPPSRPVETIVKLWGGWFGRMLPDLDAPRDGSLVVPYEVYVTLASSR